MPGLNVFTQDAFGVISLTDAVNKIPFVPGRAGQVIDWQERGVTTLSIMIEEVDGVLTMLNPTARGGPGQTRAKPKRVARSLTIPHYQHDDGINADEVQGVRAFGSETEVQTVQALVNQRQAEAITLVLDPTLEYQRVGALKGIILNADGSTLYNLFTEFGVSQEAEVDFDLDNVNPASGAVRTKCTAVVRLITNNLLGGMMFQRIHAVCGDTFWDQLIAHAEIRATYLNQQEAAQLRNGVAYETLNYGGITFENYRGKVGAIDFVDTLKAHFFPVGAPGLFKHYNAPADLIETVNTVGLPRYARMYPDQNGKLVHLEVQANPILLCTQPKVLIKGKNT